MDGWIDRQIDRQRQTETDRQLVLNSFVVFKLSQEHADEQICEACAQIKYHSISYFDHVFKVTLLLNFSMLHSSLIPRPHSLTRRNGLVSQVKFLRLVRQCHLATFNNYQSHNLIGPDYFWGIRFLTAFPDQTIFARKACVGWARDQLHRLIRFATYMVILITCIYASTYIVHDYIN